MYIPSKLITLCFIVLVFSGCSKVEYDFKALGFSSKDEMQAAFDKGYHTKQKLDEMIPPSIAAPAPQVPAVVVPPPVAASSQVEPSPAATPPQVETVVSQTATTTIPPQPAQNTNSVDVAAAAASCDHVIACADAMLGAAKIESIANAMEAARRIAAMPKPQRGDRQLARKLNSEGLISLKQRQLADAAAALTKAHESDPGDEEILSNLIYTYNEDGNFTKAEQLAYDGLLLNPRRANIWLSIAIAKQKQGKRNEALEAMWVTWQFSEDKEKLSSLLDKRISEETNSEIKSMYMNAKAWVLEGKKPNL